MDKNPRGASIKTTKLNESFSRIEGTHAELVPITKKLEVERPGAYFDPMVKRGMKPAYDKFYNVVEGGLVVPIGLTHFLTGFGVQPEVKTPDYTIQDIKAYIDTLDLPFKPYKHQILAFVDSLMNRTQINLMCTGSGKSLTIALIADFLRTRGKKGLLVVPNINLLTQFNSDIKDYNLMDLSVNTFTIGGGQTIRNFDSDFTVSTWQSLQDYKQDLDQIDYILVDETHKAKGEQLKDIIQKSSNAKYKLGFTGTLNDTALDRMTLFGLFGRPERYIKTHGLVALGLATPVQINSIQFLYSDMDRKEFRSSGAYPKQLQYIKEHAPRNLFITKLAAKITRDTGNTLVLFQHTAHGKDLFYQAMAERHSDVEVTNKDIVGKKAFDFQRKYRIYFISGEVEGKVREQIRLILEHDTDAIIYANYAVMSTGVNIKNLHNMIFASPLKSFTTITQAIGRGVRTHVSKTVFQVYDCVDRFTPKGSFMKQYFKRKEHSYEPEGFPIVEMDVTL